MRRKLPRMGRDGPYEAGEAVFIEAQRHGSEFFGGSDNGDGYSLVVKPLGRVGSSNLVRLDDVEIRDGRTGMAVADAREAIRTAGIPSIEEWREKMAGVMNSMITLGESPPELRQLKLF
ncbi:hypothetical protein AYL99_11222 [Fonsecaea erecta]|uniref:Uncharacterized protein n=1 Tax=Fonsecaea erecta TaxID=1367422 RepID=A0A178Z4T8_9EURO|nr:hypothetical protein AYL99_11222 [Fonsecaea erecta]OAP54774.1 hypothetical protein AYL99_11222 [Fonsecaea erecta]